LRFFVGCGREDGLQRFYLSAGGGAPETISAPTSRVEVGESPTNSQLLAAASLPATSLAAAFR
jgi:hypothetical protein